MTQKQLVIVATAITIGAATFALFQFGGFGGSATQAEAACESWIGEEFDSAGNTTIFGSWRKNGKIVVKVGFDPQGDTYHTRLCLFDPKTRDLSSPGAFDRAQWEN